MHKSSFINEAYERGFIYQCTDLEKLDKTLSETAVTVYLGCDATAESLHIGSLTQIMLLRLLQKHGHKIILLIGGGTTKIGDPSQRDSVRPMLTDHELKRNIDGILSCIMPYLSSYEVVNNSDWLDGLSYIPFLREVGKHFSVNRMISLDSVKSRLETNKSLSFLEFNYMVLQAYDFLELFRKYKCSLQIGGSDQWGNIICGVDLVRKIESAEVFGLTTPLLTTSDGKKMGKTLQGAVWLRKDKCSPYDFWQYWRNADDKDVGRFLRIFTDLPISEIKRLETLKNEEINEAKKILANEVTTITHGKESLKQIHEAVGAFFNNRGNIEQSNNVPVFAFNKNELINKNIIDLIIETALVTSKSEARRIIRGKGCYLNGSVVENEIKTLNEPELLNQQLTLSIGKKKFVMIKIEE